MTARGSSFLKAAFFAPTRATRSLPSARATRQAPQLRLAQQISRRALQTTTAARARLDSTTIEFARLPSTAQLALDPSAPDDSDPFSRLRVPLLPDNFEPDRSQLDGHSPEELDGPIAPAEISVIAAHPEQVVPAALTEVVGVDPDGLELSFVHDVEEGDKAAGDEGGMVRDIWAGLMDDIFGSSKTAAKK